MLNRLRKNGRTLQKTKKKREVKRSDMKQVKDVKKMVIERKGKFWQQVEGKGRRRDGTYL